MSFPNLLTDNPSRSVYLRHGFRPDRPALEIGGLHNPVVQRHEGHVRYADFTTTETLKERHADLVAGGHALVEVDYVWPGTGSLRAITGPDLDFHFIVASHVIEHVPNMLGWFRGLFDVMAENGVLNLAVPDRRYTFDVWRKTSTIGEVIEADMLGFVRPSIRQMFDHTCFARNLSSAQNWFEDIDTEKLEPFAGTHALALAYKQAADIRDRNAYIDSHCWIFTPKSFLGIISDLTKLELFDFFLDNLTPTFRGSIEFYANFRKPSRNETSSADFRKRQLDLIGKAKNQLDEANRIHRLSMDPER